MSIVLYDSFTKTKKSFIPKDPNNVTIYICGPTVYDDAHLGHARTYITFDLIHRMLELLGYNTMVTMNITDIDDKIINRSRERNITTYELAKNYELRFMEDMKTLGVQEPDVLTRVTEHIDEIIQFIQDLIDKGYAYNKDGDIRFDLVKYTKGHKYPGFNLGDNNQSDEPGDFALWKSIKDGDNLFDSPWGKGRPGWHIECSAMSTTVFGAHIDIHVGGIDLAFPHHANEIAQTESRTGEKWVNTFLHTGHLSIEGQKMSKSLKNFITIREALEKYQPHILRMYFALHKYNSSIAFSQNELDLATKTWETFQSFWRKVKGLPSEEKWTEASDMILFKLMKVRQANILAFNDDLDLPTVILNLLNLISQVHRFNANDRYPIAAMMVVKYTLTLLTKLGFPTNNSDNSNNSNNSNNSDNINGSPSTELIQAMVDFRSDVRNAAGDKKSIYKLTDKIRTHTLPKLGIKVEDQGKSSYWYHI